MKVAFAAIALCFSMVSAANGQSCAEHRELYNERFEIAKQVDDARYVDFAVMSNNAYGDYTLEFMATRTDIPSTRERWTATFECDESYDVVLRLAVDAVWHYTIKSRVANEARMLTLSTPTATVEISVSDPNDPNLQDFRTLVDETSAARKVVKGVVVETNQPQDSPLQCASQCGEMPSCPSLPLPPEPLCDSDCVDGYTCCLESAMYLYCLGACRCSFEADPPPCFAALWAQQLRRQVSCISEFADCLDLADPCDI